MLFSALAPVTRLVMSQARCGKVGCRWPAALRIVDLATGKRSLQRHTMSGNAGRAAYECLSLVYLWKPTAKTDRDVELVLGQKSFVNLPNAWRLICRSVRSSLALFFFPMDGNMSQVFCKSDKRSRGYTSGLSGPLRSDARLT